jgi:hypothetical protein
MARFFNTTGPCDPADHYMLSPERRLPDLVPYIDRKQYFVVHAPRQVGKTTAMLALAARLRQRGDVAVCASLEASQGVETVEAAELVWIQFIHQAAMVLPPSERPLDWAGALSFPVHTRLHAWLAAWSARCARPVVLLLDEADVVRGAPLISLLRQLRAGFSTRGLGVFPVSVGLIGMRDLRDYLTESKDGAPINPGSPFNIKVGSFTLRNFNAGEVVELVGQHTAETGQAFSAAALALIHEQTGGQPFLVNALSLDCVERHPGVAIEVSHVEEARERLIRARTTHLDSLGQRLREPRVARVVQSVLLGDTTVSISSDDFRYTVDLGLISDEVQPPAIANPLYREVLARELSADGQANLPAPWWPWRREDGGLDMAALIDAFLVWWARNEAMIRSQPSDGYPEAVAHLAFMGFLQRVVNGGGRVTREFAAGRGAIDLLVEYGGASHVIELKRVRPAHDALEWAVEAGTEQLGRYLDTVGQAEGWLLIFDQRPGRTWAERLWREERVVEGRTLHLRGA